jgi:putative flippase GtrA
MRRVAHRVLLPGFMKSREIAAAGLGGAVGTVADVTTLVMLVKHTGLSIPVATFVAATVGAVVCFVMNKYVAFRDRTPVSLAQLARFAGVAITTALFMALAMKVVAVGLGVPLVLAKLGCAAAIFVAWTYPAQRRLVFRNPVAA